MRFPNKFLFDQIIKNIKMFKDNKISPILMKDPKSQNYTKYINMIYHFI